MKLVDPIIFDEVFKLITSNKILGVYPNRYYCSNYGKVYVFKKQL